MVARKGVVLVAIVALGGGCSRFRCGEYEHQTGVEWSLDDEPEPIDDFALHEACGSKAGSIGYRDLLGDGVSQISLDGTHPSAHVAIALTSAIFQDVYFLRDRLAVGETLTIDDLLAQSSAYVIIDGVPVSGAFVTAASIEFLAVEEDAFWSTDRYRIRFDVTYGEPGVSEFWYTAVGEDWIAML